jgi:hypothetical protein
MPLADEARFVAPGFNRLRDELLPRLLHACESLLSTDIKKSDDVLHFVVRKSRSRAKETIFLFVLPKKKFLGRGCV